MNILLTSPSSDESQTLKSTHSQLTIALMPCDGLFEDFFDTVGVSFDIFRTELTGGWMFNYIEALQLVGVQVVLIFISSHVSETWRFRHEPTGATVCILPDSILHRAFRYSTYRMGVAKKGVIKSLDSYLVLPLVLLASELKQQGVDAILFQDYENPSFDVCVLFGKLMQMPVFASFQGGCSQRSRFERPIRPFTLRASTGLIIGSKTEIQRVSDRYQLPSQKLMQIFNPMDVTTWHPMDRKQARKMLGISDHARVAISHGRIDIIHKGLDILLEAWKQICSELPNQELCLLLVGSGSDVQELDQCIASMQITNILWVNEYIRDRTLLWQYISAADVYVLSSRYEGFPVAPIEAMTCKLPVVATDVNGIRDIFNEGEASGGIIVPCEDATALAAALGRILDDTSLGHELGKRGRHRAEQAFSFEAIGKQMRNFIFKNEADK
ncbi:putative glycosyl transferase [Nostoc commune NIES-4072]|uniref:Putative glycosyl transferase n=1 Tax=Nostoc commune NIES-4072 TaxID=2005467 RepID=A0A2R5FVG1_NOSCO|nr:glycosyltransferase family 4 protein [Nostoc commune]BBD69181.1 putative glycosyl transferase [Nostoc commune HK-02]GBG19821.1 putative glycosyl transferase [Nostoc commune NIES-4072]